MIEGAGPIWEWVGRNAEVLLFLATIALAAVTLFLVFESRAARLSATLAATPHLWEGNEDVMAIELANVGPARAKDIDVTIRWRLPDGSQSADWARRLPALGPGHSMPYHPDTLLGSDGGKPWGVTRLAVERLRLEMEWSWSDLRRPLWWFGTRRHRDAMDIDMATYQLTVHGAPNVLYQSDADRLLRGIEDLVNQDRRQRELGSSDDLLPSDMKVRVEAARIAAAWELWRARFRYWVLRRR